jgi:hypothetical protein
LLHERRFLANNTYCQPFNSDKVTERIVLAIFWTSVWFCCCLLLSKSSTHIHTAIHISYFAAKAQQRSLQYEFQDCIEGKSKEVDWQPILSFSTTTTIVGAGR